MDVLKLVPMTFHVERIDHVVLRVRDVAAMVRFYEQALGFKVERTIERLGLVQMRAGASMLDLVPGDRPSAGAGLRPRPSAQQRSHPVSSPPSWPASTWT